MTTYNFTLVLSGPSVEDDEEALNSLFEAGCDDASFGVRVMGAKAEETPVQIAEFDREAETFSTAVVSALRDIEAAGVGLLVHRVEPDDLVTATVIAERTKRTRESVRLLISGERGPGGFPAPLAWVDAKTRLWRWSDVDQWFARQLNERPSLGGSAQFVGAINAALEARAQMAALSAVAAQSRDENLPFEVTTAAIGSVQELISESSEAVQRDLQPA